MKPSTSSSSRPEAPAPGYWAVVPAAGSGTRVGAGQPKQYLSLLGRPLIEHALAPLLAAGWIEGVVVVLPPGDRQFAKLPCARQPRIHLAVGGARRADSVDAGLARVQELVGDPALPVFVLVHDAARPGLRAVDLERLRDLASDDDGGLLAVPVADTLKRAEGGQAAATVDRRDLWRAQTPQMFRLDLLQQALRRALADNLDVTDEARAMEAAGYRPRLVTGHPGNLKVTTADDLPVAEFWLQQARGAA